MNNFTQNHSMPMAENKTMDNSTSSLNEKTVGPPHTIHLLPVAIAVAVVGLVTNSLSIVVMMHEDSRKMPVSRLLIILAITDTISLFSEVNKLNDIVQFFGGQLSMVACHTAFWFKRLSGLMSHWLVVAVSIDRFIAVFLYLKASSISTVRNVNIVICSLAAVFTVYVTIGIATDGREKCLMLPTERTALIMARVFGVLNLILPMPILIIINTVTAIKLFRQPPGQLKHRNLTIMLLVTTAVFILLTLPIYLTFVTSLGDYPLARPIANWFLAVNYSSNFFIYVMVGKRFRRNMKAMFRRSTATHPMTGTTSGSTDTANTGRTPLSLITRTVDPSNADVSANATLVQTVS